MPRPAVADLPHTVTTDHRIPRVAGTPAPKPALPRSARVLPGEVDPRAYHWDVMSGEERRESARDRDAMAVKGKQDEIRIFEVIWQDSDDMTTMAVRDARPTTHESTLSLTYGGKTLTLNGVSLDWSHGNV
jgi:hypothetical protein